MQGRGGVAARATPGWSGLGGQWRRRRQRRNGERGQRRRRDGRPRGERGDRRRGWRRQQGGRRRWPRGAGRQRRHRGTANGHVRRPLPEQRRLPTKQLQERVLLQRGLLGDLPDLRQLGQQLHPRCERAGSARRLRGDRPRRACGTKGRVQRRGGVPPLARPGSSCSTATMCSGTDSVIQGSVCNGHGRCNPNAPVSCNGFLCQSNACLQTCTDGTACVTGGFCGAGTCVGPTPEPGGQRRCRVRHHRRMGRRSRPAARSPRPTCPPTAARTRSRRRAERRLYQGPGYYIPTGLGQYNVSFWAMQNQYAAENPDASAPAPPTGLFQLHLIAQTGDYYLMVSVPPRHRCPRGLGELLRDVRHL